MKLERVNLSSDKNQVGRKKKNNKNNLTTPNFGLPKVQIGNLAKDVVSFGSPVVEKKIINASDRLITGLSKFIDDFEDATKEMRNKLGRRLVKDTNPEKNWAKSKGVSYPRTEYSANEIVDSYEVEKYWGFASETKYNHENYKAKYLGGGISGDVYSIYEGNSNSPSYVIKEAKKRKHSDPIYGAGGIMQEFEALSKYKKNTQCGIALMKTRDDNYFLVSSFEPGEAAGLKHLSRTEHKFDKVNTEEKQIFIGYKSPSSEPLFKKGNSTLHDTMDIVKSLDDRNIFNADLNIGNILYSDCEPKLIDLQWQMPMYKAHKFFTFAPNEKETNFASFETGFIASYLHGVNEKNALDGNSQRGKIEARAFLKDYLKERAKYCDTSNRFERLKQTVYQNPTEDVLDAEILRLSILKNHTHQFLYNDGANETPRDMLKGLRYMARANFSAKMLSEFQPQGYVSEEQREYFEEMRKLGSFWHGKTHKWYREGLESMQAKIINYPQSRYPKGDEQVYWPKAFGQGESDAVPKNLQVVDKTMLSDILSNETKAKWDKVMTQEEKEVIRGRTFKIPALKETIKTLEAKFMDLKDAVDSNDYSSQNSLKSEISELIPEVLI